jgi:hypothetical protein
MKPPYPTRTPEGFDRRHIIFWFTVLTALAGAAAYLKMLTGFNLYDDEGSLMLSVKQYLAGMRIYDQILSAYGPVYYFYQWALRTATATPVTHDVVRISALLPWLASALISAWIVLRLTRSLVLAAAAHLATSLVLAFFRAEPGTSQELTLVLLLALAASPLLAGLEDGRTVLMLALGVLPAALLLIKVNAGVFAVAGVGMALVICAPRTRVWRVLALAAGAACTALPVVLMRNHLDAEWARTYCWLEVSSVAGCASCLLRIRPGPRVTGRDCMLAAGAFAVTFATVMAILHLQGVSMPVVYDSLVALPARVFFLHRTWFVAPRLLQGTLPWALTGLGAAVFTAWKQPRPGTTAWLILFAGKTAFGAVAVVAMLLGLPLPTIVPPFAWLLLFDPNQANDEWQDFPRRLLAILTVLQTLYAYPVAGSQFEFIQVLLLVTVVVCVGDSLTWLTESPGKCDRPMPWGQTAATAALAAVALAQGGVLVDRYRDYSSLPSLDLPGARLLHVEPNTKANFHWLVRNLKEQCDSFESLPGLPSLNFWTGIEPLTGLNVDDWTLALSPDQQRQVVAAISSHPRACMVYNRPLARFWNPTGENLENLPLVHYIFRNFQPVGSSGDYQLMLRNERRIGAAAVL